MSTSPRWAHLSPRADRAADRAEYDTFPREGPPSLRIVVPSADYMLALKLKAIRILDPAKGQDEACRRIAAGTLQSIALGDFLQAFYTQPSIPARGKMLADEPASSGDARLDALVGGIAEYLFKRWAPDHPPGLAVRLLNSDGLIPVRYSRRAGSSPTWAHHGSRR